jgi:hypothetical protein
MTTINDDANTFSAINTPQDRITMLDNGISEMLAFALNKGIQLPANLAQANGVQLSDESSLIATYNSFSTAIAPATLESIKYIDSRILSGGTAPKWFMIPIFTKCITIAIIALIALISVSLLPEVNQANQLKGVLESSGLVLLYNLIFVCSAALLGVMFYLLKTVTDKIKDHSLTPIDGIEVNAHIIIGVISGFIIAELFNFNIDTLSQYVEIRKMTLALLGGFSADAIFSVLKGIINKTKAFFLPQT